MLKALASFQTHTVYILADSSKFGRVNAATILPLGDAQIITDYLPDQRDLDRTDVIVV